MSTPTGNVADRLHASALRVGGKAALIAGDREVSYAALDEAADRGAAALRGLGLAAGDRVAIMVGNVGDFAVAVYGALRAGLTAVPLNTGLTPAEVGHILRDSGATVAIATGETSPRVEDAGVPLSRTVVVPAGWAELGEAPAVPDPGGVGGDAPALLQYTSGTTGSPRGAVLSHAALLANQQQMEATRLRIEERDVVLCALPLFHIYALNVALLFPLARGATVLLEERFDPVASLEDIARHRVSVIVGVPPMFGAWVRAGRGSRDMASVRLAVSGAAPLPVELSQRFSAEFGIPIWEGYGLTETAPLLTTTGMGNDPLPGSVGRPVPGVELRIVDEAGVVAAQGDPGEVVARGPNLFSGYWQDPEATAEVLDADGWFHTGDVGYLDGGNLYLVDRKRDLVIVNGFNVYPKEVEAVLSGHPDVAEVAVVGVPDEETGEAVKAFVVTVPGSGVTPEDLEAHCRRFLARYKCPASFAFLDALPHQPTGKIRRRALRELG